MNENIPAIFIYIAANFELNRIAEKGSNIRNFKHKSNSVPSLLCKSSA